MREYLSEINMLDIITVDGSYAEGRNAQGEVYSMQASGNGDFYNHKVEFKQLKP